MLTIFLACGLTVFVTLATIPVAAWFSRKTGATGLDVHKSAPIQVPKLGGISLVAGSTAGFLLLTVLSDFALTAPLLSSSFLAALIGLFEDYREINPLVKPALITVAGVPVLLAEVYSSNPVLPFVGQSRLTIVYPLLIVIGFSVVCNAVNSLDVLNGSMALTSLAAFIPLATVAFLENKMDIFGLCVITMVSLASFLTKNIYPAKVFAGNVGSLYIGALLTFVAVAGRMEVVAIVALLPHIMNEFHIIYSLRGFRSGKKYATRPTILQSNIIRANPNKKAPITLVRMLTAGKGLTEKEVVNRLFLLCLYSSLLSLLTYFLFLGVT